MSCVNKNYVLDLNIKNVIYGLVDPNTNEIRYIGKAINLKNRVINHLKPSRLITKTHKNNWLNFLIKDDKKPFIIVLEKNLDESVLNDFEMKWIKYYKKIGCNLTNGTNGGDGGKMNTEVIEKMKKTKSINKQKGFWLNKNFSEEHCKNISEGKKGYITSDETKLKLSKSHIGINTWSKGVKLSDETKSKMSDSKKGIIKNKKPVYQLDLEGNIIKLWDAPYYAEKELNLTRSKIHSVCIGKRKKTGGFRWVYVDDYDKLLLI